MRTLRRGFFDGRFLERLGLNEESLIPEARNREVWGGSILSVSSGSGQNTHKERRADEVKIQDFKSYRQDLLTIQARYEKLIQIRDGLQALFSNCKSWIRKQKNLELSPDSTSYHAESGSSYV